MLGADGTETMQSLYERGLDGHDALSASQHQPSVIIMLSLFRRLSIARAERYYWKPAVDLTNPRVIASLLSMYNR